MTSLPLLAVGILMNIVMVLFVFVCVVLILVILIQKGRGGGLSGAFGGGMASGLLGSKTGDFLTWVTIGLVAVFLGLAVLMAKFYRPSVSEPVPAGSGQVAPTSTEQSTPAESQQAAPATQPSTPSSPAAQPAPADSGAEQPVSAPATGGTSGQ